MLFGKDFFYYHNRLIRFARFRGKDKREFIDNQQVEDYSGVIKKYAFHSDIENFNI